MNLLFFIIPFFSFHAESRTELNRPKATEILNIVGSNQEGTAQLLYAPSRRQDLGTLVTHIKGAPAESMYRLLVRAGGTPVRDRELTSFSYISGNNVRCEKQITMFSDITRFSCDIKVNPFKRAGY